MRYFIILLALVALGVCAPNVKQRAGELLFETIIFIMLSSKRFNKNGMKIILYYYFFFLKFIYFL